ncbi:transposable element Tcb2 transposase [Trichonephila clavipes]|nr:transposable element Tcb2 transposase [Trichonephila clavipes]
MYSRSQRSRLIEEVYWLPYGSCSEWSARTPHLYPWEFRYIKQRVIQLFHQHCRNFETMLRMLVPACHADWNPGNVADVFGVARSVVARLWNRFQEAGNVRRRPGAGRPRATISTVDRYIQLTARRNRTENATQLQRQLLLVLGRRVFSQTVHESRFSLECDTRRVLVWRDRGTRNNHAFVRERSQYRTAGWMVWGEISIGARTDLHIIRNGTLTGRRYADEILRPHVIPYAGAIGDSFVFQDDNARPHRARLVENMLEAEAIQRMEWPACSPDLNPIEHVWDMFGRRATKATCYCPRLGDCTS